LPTGVVECPHEVPAVIESRFVVRVDYAQYYCYGSTDFVESSVDDAMDGVVGPGDGGVRIHTGVRYGEVSVTVRVIDGPIALPDGGSVVVSAFNLDVPGGVFAVCDWAGPAVDRHDFGRPLRCGVLVEVYDRDEARERQIHRQEAGPVMPCPFASVTSSRFRRWPLSTTAGVARQWTAPAEGWTPSPITLPAGSDSRR